MVKKGVLVDGLVFNKNGKVLLRKKEEAWEFPNAEVLEGERRREALARAIRNNFRIDIEILDLLDDSRNSFLAHTKSHVEDKGDMRWVHLFDIVLDDLTRTSKENYLEYIRKYGSNAPLVLR